jgi:hypothetical protein
MTLTDKVMELKVLNVGRLLRCSANSALPNHRPSRHVQHILVIACMSAAGESFLPYIVTSQMRGFEDTVAGI